MEPSGRGLGGETPNVEEQPGLSGPDVAVSKLHLWSERHRSTVIPSVISPASSIMKLTRLWWWRSGVRTEAELVVGRVLPTTL